MGIDWEDMYGYDDYDPADYGDYYDADVAELDDIGLKKPKDRYAAYYNIRYYVFCPYEKREIAKRLGGRWDPNRKKWYFSYRSDAEKLVRILKGQDCT